MEGKENPMLDALRFIESITPDDFGERTIAPEDMGIIRAAIEQAEAAKPDIEPHIVVTGNVIDGYAFVGPFDDYDSALAWAEDLPPVDDWHVAILDSPIELVHVHDKDCKYLGNDTWNCGHMDNQPAKLVPLTIPEDFPVKPLSTIDETIEAIDRATCGHCGLSWDDGISTSMTPAPSGRCPFEAFHQYPDDE